MSFIDDMLGAKSETDDPSKLAEMQKFFADPAYDPSLAATMSSAQDMEQEVPISPGTTGTEDFMKLDPTESYDAAGNLTSVQVFGEQWDLDRLRKTTYGQDILNLVAANKKGRRGFGEAVADRASTKFIPFVNDITAVGLSIRDTIKTKATLQKLMDRVPLDDEEKIAARYFLAAQEREQMQTGWGKFGSVVSQAPSFAFEFALTGGLGKVLLKGAAERALVNVGVEKTLKLFTSQFVKQAGREVAEEAGTKLSLDTFSKLSRSALSERILADVVEEGTDDVVIGGLRDVVSKRSIRLARPLLKDVTDEAAQETIIKGARKQAADEVASAALHEADMLTKGGRNRMLQYATRTYRESMSELLLGPGTTAPKTWGAGLGKAATVLAMSGPIGAARLAVDESIHGIISLGMGEDHLVTPTELALASSAMAQQNQKLMDSSYMISLGIRWQEYASESTGQSLTALGQGIASSVKGTGMGRYLAGVGGRVSSRTGQEEGAAVRSWLFSSLTGKEVADAARMTTREVAETVVKANAAKTGRVLAGEALEEAIQAETKATMGKLHVTALGRAMYSIMERTGIGPKNINNFLVDVGYDGVLQEMYEERVNDFTTGLLGLNDRPDEFGWHRIRQAFADAKPSGEDLLVEAAAFALPALARKGMMHAQTQLMAGGLGKLNLLSQELEAALRLAKGGVAVLVEKPVAGVDNGSVLVAQERVKQGEGTEGSTLQKAKDFAESENKIDADAPINTDNVLAARRRVLEILNEIGPMMTDIQSGTVSPFRKALSSGIGVINAMLNGSPALATYDPIAGALSRFDPELGFLAQEIGIVHQNLVKRQTQDTIESGQSREDILNAVKPEFATIVEMKYRQFMADRGVVVISEDEVEGNARQLLANRNISDPTPDEVQQARTDFLEATRVMAADHMRAIKQYNYQTVVTGLPGNASDALELAATYFVNVHNFSIEQGIDKQDVIDGEPSQLTGAKELDVALVDRVAGEVEGSQMSADTMLLARQLGLPIETEGEKSAAVSRVREHAKAMAKSKALLHTFKTMTRVSGEGENQKRQRIRIIEGTGSDGQPAVNAVNMVGSAANSSRSYANVDELLADLGHNQEGLSWTEEKHRLFLTPTRLRFTESGFTMFEYLAQYAIAHNSGVRAPTYDTIIREGRADATAADRAGRFERYEVLKELATWHKDNPGTRVSDDLKRRVAASWGSTRYLTQDGEVEVGEASRDYASVEKEVKEWLEAAGHHYGKVTATGRAAWSVAPSASNLNGDVYLSRTNISTGAIVEDAIEALMHNRPGLFSWITEEQRRVYSPAVRGIIGRVQQLLNDENRWVDVVKTNPNMAKHLAAARSLYDPTTPSVEAVSKLISAIVFNNYNNANFGYIALGDIAKDVRSDPSYAPFLAVVESFMGGSAHQVNPASGFHRLVDAVRYWTPKKDQDALTEDMKRKSAEYFAWLGAASAPEGGISMIEDPEMQAWYAQHPWEFMASEHSLGDRTNAAVAVSHKDMPEEVVNPPPVYDEGYDGDPDPAPVPVVKPVQGKEKVHGGAVGFLASLLKSKTPKSEEAHSLVMQHAQDPNRVFGIARVMLAHALYGRARLPDSARIFNEGLTRLGIHSPDLRVILRDPTAFLGRIGDQDKARGLADLVVDMLSSYDASLNLSNTDMEAQTLRDLFTRALLGVGVTEREADNEQSDVTVKDKYSELIGSPVVQTFKLATQLLSPADRGTESIGTLIERIRREVSGFAESSALVKTALLPNTELGTKNVFSDDMIYDDVVRGLCDLEQTSPRLYAMGITLQSLSRESGRRLLSTVRHQMPVEGVATTPSGKFKIRETSSPTGVYESAVFDSVARQIEGFFASVDGEAPSMTQILTRMRMRSSELREALDIVAPEKATALDQMDVMIRIADIVLGKGNLVSMSLADPTVRAEFVSRKGRYSNLETKSYDNLSKWMDSKFGIRAELKAMAKYLADFYEVLSPADAESIARLEAALEGSSPRNFAAEAAVYAANESTMPLRRKSNEYDSWRPPGKGSHMHNFLDHMYKRQRTSVSSHDTTYEGRVSTTLLTGDMHQAVLDLVNTIGFPAEERESILTYGTYLDGTAVLVRPTMDMSGDAASRTDEGDGYEDEYEIGHTKKIKIFSPTMRRLYDAAAEHYDNVVRVVQGVHRPRYVIVPFYAGESSPQGINIPTSMLQTLTGAATEADIPDTLDKMFTSLVQAIPYLQHPLKRQHSSGGTGPRVHFVDSKIRLGVVLAPGQGLDDNTQKSLLGMILFNGFKNAKPSYKAHGVSQYALLKGVEINAQTLDTELAKFVASKNSFVLSDNDGAKYTRLSLELSIGGKERGSLKQLLFHAFAGRPDGVISPEEIRTVLGIPENGEIQTRFPGSGVKPVTTTFDEAFPGLEVEIVNLDGQSRIVLSTEETDFRFMTAANLTSDATIGITDAYSNFLNDSGARGTLTLDPEAQAAHDQFMESVEDYRTMSYLAHSKTSNLDTESKRRNHVADNLSRYQPYLATLVRMGVLELNDPSVAETAGQKMGARFHAAMDKLKLTGGRYTVGAPGARSASNEFGDPTWVNNGDKAFVTSDQILGAANPYNEFSYVFTAAEAKWYKRQRRVSLASSNMQGAWIRNALNLNEEHEAFQGMTDQEMVEELENRLLRLNGLRATPAEYTTYLRTKIAPLMLNHDGTTLFFDESGAAITDAKSITDASLMSMVSFEDLFFGDPENSRKVRVDRTAFYFGGDRKPDANGINKIVVGGTIHYMSRTPSGNDAASEIVRLGLPASTVKLTRAGKRRVVASDGSIKTIVAPVGAVVTGSDNSQTPPGEVILISGKDADGDQDKNLVYHFDYDTGLVKFDYDVSGTADLVVADVKSGSDMEQSMYRHSSGVRNTVMRSMIETQWNLPVQRNQERDAGGGFKYTSDAVNKRTTRYQFLWTEGRRPTVATSFNKAYTDARFGPTVGSMTSIEHSIAFNAVTSDKQILRGTLADTPVMDVFSRGKTYQEFVQSFAPGRPFNEATDAMNAALHRPPVKVSVTSLQALVRRTEEVQRAAEKCRGMAVAFKRKLQTIAAHDLWTTVRENVPAPTQAQWALLNDWLFRVANMTFDEEGEAKLSRAGFHPELMNIYHQALMTRNWNSDAELQAFHDMWLAWVESPVAQDIIKSERHVQTVQSDYEWAPYGEENLAKAQEATKLSLFPTRNVMERIDSFDVLLAHSSAYPKRPKEVLALEAHVKKAETVLKNLYRDGVYPKLIQRALVRRDYAVAQSKVHYRGAPELAPGLVADSIQSTLLNITEMNKGKPVWEQKYSRLERERAEALYRAVNTMASIEAMDSDLRERIARSVESPGELMRIIETAFLHYYRESQKRGSPVFEACPNNAWLLALSPLTVDKDTSQMYSTIKMRQGNIADSVELAQLQAAADALTQLPPVTVTIKKTAPGSLNQFVRKPFTMSGAEFMDLMMHYAVVTSSRPASFSPQYDSSFMSIMPMRMIQQFSAFRTRAMQVENLPTPIVNHVLWLKKRVDFANGNALIDMADEVVNLIEVPGEYTAPGTDVPWTHTSRTSDKDATVTLKAKFVNPMRDYPNMSYYKKGFKTETHPDGQYLARDIQVAPATQSDIKASIEYLFEKRSLELHPRNVITVDDFRDELPNRGYDVAPPMQISIPQGTPVAREWPDDLNEEHSLMMQAEIPPPASSLDSLKAALLGRKLLFAKPVRHMTATRVTEALAFLFPRFDGSSDKTEAEFGTLRHAQFREAILGMDPTATPDDVVVAVRDLVLERYPEADYTYHTEVEMSLGLLKGTADLIVEHKGSGRLEVVDYKKIKAEAAKRPDQIDEDVMERDKRLAQVAIYRYMLQAMGFDVSDNAVIINYPDLAVEGATERAFVTESSMEALSPIAQAAVVTTLEGLVDDIVFDPAAVAEAHRTLFNINPESPTYVLPSDRELERRFASSGALDGSRTNHWYKNLYQMWKGLKKSSSATASDPVEMKKQLQVALAAREALRERAEVSSPAIQAFARMLLHTHVGTGRRASKATMQRYGAQIGAQHEHVSKHFNELIAQLAGDSAQTNEAIRVHTTWQVLSGTWGAVNRYGLIRGEDKVQELFNGAEPVAAKVQAQKMQAALEHPGLYDPVTGEEDFFFKKLSYVNYSQYFASAIMPHFHGINPRDIVQNREMEALAVRYRSMAEFWALLMGTANHEYLAFMEDTPAGHIRDDATGQHRRLTAEERVRPEHQVQRMQRINSMQRIKGKLKLTDAQYDMLVMFSQAVRGAMSGGNRWMTGIQVSLSNFQDDSRKKVRQMPDSDVFLNTPSDIVNQLKKTSEVIPTIYVMLEQMEMVLPAPFVKLARAALADAASHAENDLNMYAAVHEDTVLSTARKAYLYEQSFLTYLRAQGWVEAKPGRTQTELDDVELRDAILTVPHDLIQSTFRGDAKLMQMLKDANRNVEQFDITSMAARLQSDFLALQQEAMASAPYLMSSEAYQDLFQFRDPLPFIRGSGNYRFFNDLRMDKELMSTEEMVSRYADRLKETLSKENVNLRIKDISNPPTPRIKLFKDLMKELDPSDGNKAQGSDRDVWNKMKAGEFENQGITEDSTIADLSIALHGLAMIVITNRAINTSDASRNPLQSAEAIDDAKKKDEPTLGDIIQALRREATNNGWALNLSGMTPEQVYSRHGLLSSNDTVADILGSQAIQITAGLRKISAVNAMLMTKNEFGKPLVFALPSDSDENSIVPEAMWSVLARWWAQSEGYNYDETLSGKQNARKIFQDMAEKKSNAKSQMAVSFKGNRHAPDVAFHHIVKTNIMDIPSMLTRLDRQGSDQYSITPYGDAAAWALHLVSPPAQSSPNSLVAAYDWTIQASKGVAMWGSAFHLNAVGIESGYAAGGVGYLIGLLAGSKHSKVLDAFGKTAAGKAMGVNDSLASVWDMMRLSRSNDPYFQDLKSFAAAIGLDFLDAKHNPIDVHRGSLRDNLKSLRKYAKESGADNPEVFSFIDKFLYAMQDDVQEWTFETVTNAVKLTIAANLMSKFRMRALQEGRWFDPMREMKRWAPYVDTEIGSIDPVMYPWAHPDVLKKLRRSVFSWQWTMGAMEAAGMGALTHKITGFQLHPEVQAYMVPRWMRMFFGVMYGVPMALQFSLKAMSVAMGDDDPRDKWWIWNNPEGKNFDFNVDPMLRAIARAPGTRWFHDHVPLLGQLLPGAWGDDPTLGNRQTFMHQGKQGWEIMGWFTQPKANIFGKAALPIQRGWEMVLNESPGMDWDMPWRGKPVGETYVARIAHGLKLFVPFSIASIDRNSNAGILNMVGPVGKGVSKTEVSNALQGLMYTWSQETHYNELFSSPSMWSSQENLTREWLNAARVNGLGGELKSIISGARGKVIRELYMEVFAALPRSVDDPVDTPKLEAAMRALLRLDFTYANLMQSVETRRKGQSQKIRYTQDLTNIQDKAIRDAFWKGYSRKKEE